MLIFIYPNHYQNVNCAEKPFVNILFLNNKKTTIFSYSDLYIDTYFYLPNKNEYDVKVPITFL